MHLAPKLALLALMATLAMTLSATAASAVIVTEEDHSHCPAVTPVSHGAGGGGCPLLATSEGSVRLENPFGSSLCTMSFTIRLDENGSGYISSQNLGGGGGCGLVPCAESGVKDVWPINLTSETTMEFDFCVVAFGFVTVTCHLSNVQVHEIDHNNTELATIGDHDCENNANYGLEGHWNASSNGIEVLH